MNRTLLFVALLSLPACHHHLETSAIRPVELDDSLDEDLAESPEAQEALDQAAREDADVPPEDLDAPEDLDSPPATAESPKHKKKKVTNERAVPNDEDLEDEGFNEE